MPETRKLAAILFAAVVGYSRLMGEDEAGTARHARWRVGRAIDRIGAISYRQRVY